MTQLLNELMSDFGFERIIWDGERIIWQRTRDGIVETVNDTEGTELAMHVAEVETQLKRIGPFSHRIVR